MVVEAAGGALTHRGLTLYTHFSLSNAPKITPGGRHVSRVSFPAPCASPESGSGLSLIHFCCVLGLQVWEDEPAPLECSKLPFPDGHVRIYHCELPLHFHSLPLARFLFSLRACVGFASFIHGLVFSCGLPGCEAGGARQHVGAEWGWTVSRR